MCHILCYLQRKITTTTEIELQKQKTKINWKRCAIVCVVAVAVKLTSTYLPFLYKYKHASLHSDRNLKYNSCLVARPFHSMTMLEFTLFPTSLSLSAREINIQSRLHTAITLCVYIWWNSLSAAASTDLMSILCFVCAFLKREKLKKNRWQIDKRLFAYNRSLSDASLMEFATISWVFFIIFKFFK